MKLPKMPKRKELTIAEIRKNIIDAIANEYGGSTVAEFCQSEYVKELGIKGPTIQNYLSPGGSISFPAFKKLYAYFNLGKLSQEVKVTKVVKFYTKD